MTTQPPQMETLTELKIDGVLRQKVMEAYDQNDWPIMVGYIEEGDLPGMSFRGSVVVVSETQLGFWARNAEGSTVSALDRNPNLMLVYREPRAEHGRSAAIVNFRGKGRVEREGSLRDQVYDTMAQRERDADADKAGVAIIVDIESVNGIIPGYRLRMER